jgi:threonine/homoserine/homoserine lactone efflux protein
VLAAGLVSSFAILEQALDVISIVGGLAILGFAAIQLAAIGKIGKRLDKTKVVRNPFITGVTLSALNPFFLIWWFTAGLKLISDSLSFGLILGIALVFGFHIWMDFAWLFGSAYLSSKGTSLLNSKYYKILMLILIAVLILFGVNFIFSGLS